MHHYNHIYSKHFWSTLNSDMSEHCNGMGTVWDKKKLKGKFFCHCNLVLTNNCEDLDFFLKNFCVEFPTKLLNVTVLNKVYAIHPQDICEPSRGGSQITWTQTAWTWSEKDEPYGFDENSSLKEVEIKMKLFYTYSFFNVAVRERVALSSFRLAH